MKLILPVIALSAATYAGYKNHRLNLQLANYQNIAYAAEMDGDSLVLQSLSTRSAIPTDLTATQNIKLNACFGTPLYAMFVP